jgi:hypothetical protein
MSKAVLEEDSSVPTKLSQPVSQVELRKILTTSPTQLPNCEQINKIPVVLSN